MPKISNTPIKAPILGKKSEIPPPPPPFCFIQDTFLKYFSQKYEAAFDKQKKTEWNSLLLHWGGTKIYHLS